MQTRINYSKVQPAIQTLLHLGNYSDGSGLEQSLTDLMLVRASQINHCAFCLDMHIKDARVSGETEQRLYGLSVWREMPIYSDRERAALAWTEAVTLISENGVPDDVYEQARAQFSEQEIVALTMTVITINSWNRLNVGLQFSIAGSYKPQRKPALDHATANN